MNNSATTNQSPNPAATGKLNLADPRTRPDADIVIFDGKCRFCRNQVLRLDWFDGGNRLAYLSLHDPRVAETFPDLTHDQLMREMVVVTQDGRRFGGAAAVRYLSRRLPRLWWLAPLLHVPFSMPLWQWLYQRVAVRRYKLAGREPDVCTDESCHMHLHR
jgi:predicted DCC family thiol-disulfide oxidoreductase YuxK